MTTAEKRTIVVTGATGRQGGAVVRHLLSDGWQVRALTRDPRSARAQALASLGATVVQANMNEPASLQPAFQGAYGAYSVQTPYSAGPEAEVRQGKNVADVAKAAGIQHFVYASAGIGPRRTGVPSWETKLQIEEHVRRLELPLTIVRPMAFMELMTDKAFYPAVSTWQVMPTLMGPSRKVGWLCTEDLGAIVARIFADPDRYIGEDLKLVSDIQSIDESRAIYRTVMGKAPPRFPMPVWLFARFGFVGKDLTAMWRWLRTETFDMDTGVTRNIHPGALTVEQWLSQQAK